MHEQGLLNAAVAALVDAARPHRLREVVLAVGPSIDEPAARAAWVSAAAGSLAQDAAVSWQPSYDRLSCFQCGQTYAGASLSRCPDCGGNGLVVRPAPEVAVLDWTAGPLE